MQEMYVGLDISKRFHVAHIDGRKKPFRFNHDFDGFEALRSFVLEQAEGRAIVFGLEPTGPYSGILAAWLAKQGWEIRMIPGATTKAEKRAYVGSSLKTDAVDAYVVSKLCKDPDKFRPYRDHEQAVFELRDLSQVYLRVNKMWVDTLNRLHGQVDVVFPEMSAILNMKTRTPRELLKAYPDPRQIAQLELGVFQTFMQTVSRGQLSVEKVKRVHQAAQKTIGASTGTLKYELNMLLSLLDQLEHHRHEIESQMGGLLQHFEYAPNLKTIPGFGTVVTAVLIGQVGDIRSYRSSKQLIKACGLNLIEHSSGKHVGRTTISYMGSPILRRYLFQAAVVAISKRHSVFREWFQAQKREKKPNNVVIVAGMRKLLRVAHAIARDNRPFEPDQH